VYLIDTSIWIDYFRKKENSGVKFFVKILEQKWPYGITGLIYQEILQGVSSQKDFEQLSMYLETQKFYHPKDPIISYQAAAQKYFLCRKKGITIRSTVDCFIAQIAIEHNLCLVHNDRDYSLIKKVCPELNCL